MCSNIQVKKDPAENLKFDKAKSSDKIDGMVALAMAMGQYMIDLADDDDEDTIYDERDILLL